MLLKNYKKIENSKNLVFYPRKKNDLLEVSFKLLKSIKIFAKQNRRPKPREVEFVYQNVGSIILAFLNIK